MSRGGYFNLGTGVVITPEPPNPPFVLPNPAWQPVGAQIAQTPEPIPLTTS
jgi:hypothetical protein